MKRFLIVLSTEPSLKYAVDLISGIQMDSSKQVIFFGGKEQLRKLQLLGLGSLDYVDFNDQTIKTLMPKAEAGKKEATSTAAPVPESRYTKMTRYLLVRILANTALIFRSRSRWKKILKRYDFSAALVFGDNMGLASGDMLRLFNKKDIKIITLPVALSQQEIIAELRFNKKLFLCSTSGFGISNILARLFPKQVITYREQKLFYHTKDEVVSMLLAGSLTPDPWVLGMSRATTSIFATSWEKNYWVEKGLAANKAKVCGYMELDRLKQIRFDDTLSASNSQWGTVAYSVPNFFEHNIYSWEQHINFIESHIKIMKAYSHKVLLLLHPKMNTDNYRFLEEKYNCQISKGATQEALLETDVYVTIASTTALWAALLGIRVLDIGAIYKFDVAVFEQVPEITAVTSLTEMDQYLSQIFLNGRKTKDLSWYCNLESRKDFFTQKPSKARILDTIGLN